MLPVSPLVSNVHAASILPMSLLSAGVVESVSVGSGTGRYGSVMVFSTVRGSAPSARSEGRNVALYVAVEPPFALDRLTIFVSDEVSILRSVTVPASPSLFVYPVISTE